MDQDEDQEVAEGMEGIAAEYAVKLHSLFAKTIDKYGEQCVLELFPFCVEMLENFNYHLLDSEKLANDYDDLEKKYKDMSEAFDKLKILRKKDLDKSLKIEDDLEQELFESSEKIKNLEEKLKQSLRDVEGKHETLNYLNDTVNCLNLQMEHLLHDKINLQNEIAMLRAQFYIPVQYSTIAMPVTVQTVALNVFQNLPDQPTTSNFIDLPPVLNENRKKKKKMYLSLYSDDRGKNLSVLFKKQFSNRNVYIKPCLVKSGAPLTEILRALMQDGHRLGVNDFVAIIGGSNDIGFSKRESIAQSYNDLINSNINCKFIISTIPPRYDLSPYCNENILIREVNSQVKTISEAALNVRVLDLGSKKRKYFAVDGKHFNTAGKTSLVKDIYKIITQW